MFAHEPVVVGKVRRQSPEPPQIAQRLHVGTSCLEALAHGLELTE
jgi:hypothetical protein